MRFNNKISDTIIIIGKNVKKYRKAKGLTQQDLAFYCEKTDRSTISVVLGVDVCELFIKNPL